MGSTFSQKRTLFSSSRKLNYFKLLATAAFLKPKKLLCLSHVSFLDFLFLFLSADHSQVDLSCPAFFSKFRLRHARNRWPQAPAWPWGPHSHRLLPTQFLISLEPAHLQAPRVRTWWQTYTPSTQLTPGFIILYTKYLSNSPPTS